MVTCDVLEASPMHHLDRHWRAAPSVACDAALRTECMVRNEYKPVFSHTGIGAR